MPACAACPQQALVMCGLFYSCHVINTHKITIPESELGGLTFDDEAIFFV